MNSKVTELINIAVQQIIDNSSSEEKINNLKKKHDVKIHFIPKRYRIFGGLLQSMNIQFGNFIEVLMSLIIANDGRYEIIRKYSGNKNNNFKLSKINDALIDEYISMCQTEDVKIDNEFPRLINKIIENKNGESNSFKHDIDLLFQNIQTKTYYYLECKYNDDHDTGKFVDINRKFIKTYAYLAKELDINNTDELVPILFFFTNKKLKGNIYIPENSNIYRGKKFFDTFLNIKYEDVDKYLSELSENDVTIDSFQNLYKKVVESDLVCEKI